MHKLFSRILFVTLSLCFGLTAQAQTLGSFQQVQFVVGPEAPGPNQQTTIEARAAGNFLQDAKFTWTRDGRVVQSGIGAYKLTFTTPSAGITTRIHVDIDSAAAGQFSKDFVFTPANIQLIWEADTSVPPFYRGKALYSAGSKINIIALPQVTSGGVVVSPNSLSYQWSVSGQPVTQASGIGRTTFSYYGNQLNQSERIGLTVRYGGTPVGSASLILPAVEPVVNFYVKDPLRGILFDQALPTNVTLLDREVTFSAQPFYFSNESLGKTVTYNWRLNGQAVTGEDTQKGVLTLRQSGSGGGQAVVSLELQNSDNFKFLQNAVAQLRIIFGQQTNTQGGFSI